MLGRGAPQSAEQTLPMAGARRRRWAVVRTNLEVELVGVEEESRE
jgi:hypothetical protein